MKKFIISFVIIGLLLIPSLSLAQSNYFDLTKELLTNSSNQITTSNILLTSWQEGDNVKAIVVNQGGSKEKLSINFGIGKPYLFTSNFSIGKKSKKELSFNKNEIIKDSQDLNKLTLAILEKNGVVTNTTPIQSDKISAAQITNSDYLVDITSTTSFDFKIKLNKLKSSFEGDDYIFIPKKSVTDNFEVDYNLTLPKSYKLATLDKESLQLKVKNNTEDEIKSFVNKYNANDYYTLETVSDHDTIGISGLVTRLTSSATLQDYGYIYSCDNKISSCQVSKFRFTPLNVLYKKQINNTAKTIIIAMVIIMLVMLVIKYINRKRLDKYFLLVKHMLMLSIVVLLTVNGNQIQPLRPL